MKNNKLIAEFMGYTHQSDSAFKDENGFWNDFEVFETWNWLIPVVDKYYEKLESMYEKDEWEWRVKLHEQLLDINLEGLYKVVVEFIQYKNQEL